jgi:hypothetical protein
MPQAAPFLFFAISLYQMLILSEFISKGYSLHFQVISIDGIHNLFHPHFAVLGCGSKNCIQYDVLNRTSGNLEFFRQKIKVDKSHGTSEGSAHFHISLRISLDGTGKSTTNRNLLKKAESIFSL